MLELTKEQRQVISGEENPTILDPQTNETYVLVRKTVFDRIKGLLYDDSDMTHDELRLLLARSSKENGWDEPGMEDYDNYDEQGKRIEASSAWRLCDQSGWCSGSATILIKERR